jgi:hypothetical protein
VRLTVDKVVAWTGLPCSWTGVTLEKVYVGPDPARAHSCRRLDGVARAETWRECSNFGEGIKT